jgi:hypothetical protein
MAGSWGARQLLPELLPRSNFWEAQGHVPALAPFCECHPRLSVVRLPERARAKQHQGCLVETPFVVRGRQCYEITSRLPNLNEMEALMILLILILLLLFGGGGGYYAFGPRGGIGIGGIVLIILVVMLLTGRL